MFFKGSRYERVKSAKMVDLKGREIRYMKIRFTPDTPANVGHVVAQGDRLDNLANRYLHNPEKFWRICDANQAMWPDDLLSVPGRMIRMPPSEG